MKKIEDKHINFFAKAVGPVGGLWLEYLSKILYETNIVSYFYSVKLVSKEKRRVDISVLSEKYLYDVSVTNEGIRVRQFPLHKIAAVHDSFGGTLTETSEAELMQEILSYKYYLHIRFDDGEFIEYDVEGTLSDTEDLKAHAAKIKSALL